MTFSRAPAGNRSASSPSDDERAERTIDLMRERIGARWATHIFMLAVG